VRPVLGRGAKRASCTRSSLPIHKLQRPTLFCWLKVIRLGHPRRCLDPEVREYFSHQVQSAPGGNAAVVGSPAICPPTRPRRTSSKRNAFRLGDRRGHAARRGPPTRASPPPLVHHNVGPWIGIRSRRSMDADPRSKRSAHISIACNHFGAGQLASIVPVNAIEAAPRPYTLRTTISGGPGHPAITTDPPAYGTEGHARTRAHYHRRTAYDKTFKRFFCVRRDAMMSRLSRTDREQELFHPRALTRET